MATGWVGSKALFVHTWTGSHQNFEPINICVHIYNIQESGGLNIHFDKNYLQHFRYFEHTFLSPVAGEFRV